MNRHKIIKGWFSQNDDKRCSRDAKLVKKAFFKVLESIPEKDFKKLLSVNFYIVPFKAAGIVYRYRIEAKKDVKLMILDLYYLNKCKREVIENVIAHEVGHLVCKGGLTSKKCEYIANRYARQQGFPEYKPTQKEKEKIKANNKRADVLSSIVKVWRKNPQLRLGQLICNAIPEKELYHISNEKLKNKLGRRGKRK